VDVAPEQVVVTAGASQALLLASLALIEPGSSAVLFDPLLPAVPRARADGRGPRRVRAPAGRGRPPARPRAPGGEPRRQHPRPLPQLAERHDLLVVSDEVYRDLTYDGGPAPSILSVPGMDERTIVVDSFSKRLAMCGWRLGFAVAPPAVARRLEALLFVGAICAPSFVQQAGLEALRSPLSAAAPARMHDELDARRHVMLRGLAEIPGVRCSPPGGAFFAFPDIRQSGLGDRELAGRLLLDRGVAVLPGLMFGAGGAGHLRLSYAGSVAEIEEGVRGLRLQLGQRPHRRPRRPLWGRTALLEAFEHQGVRRAVRPLLEASCTHQVIARIV